MVREIVDWFGILWFQLTDLRMVFVRCDFDNRFYCSYPGCFKYVWSLLFESILTVFVYGFPVMRVAEQFTIRLHAAWTCKVTGKFGVRGWATGSTFRKSFIPETMAKEKQLLTNSSEMSGVVFPFSYAIGGVVSKYFTEDWKYLQLGLHTGKIRKNTPSNDIYIFSQIKQN